MFAAFSAANRCVLVDLTHTHTLKHRRLFHVFFVVFFFCFYYFANIFSFCFSFAQYIWSTLLSWLSSAFYFSFAVFFLFCFCSACYAQQRCVGKRNGEKNRNCQSHPWARKMCATAKHHQRTNAHFCVADGGGTDRHPKNSSNIFKRFLKIGRLFHSRFLGAA